MMADSEIGVSRQRASPNSSTRPAVAPKAPPYGPTSSPSTNTFESRRISSKSASRIASRYVISFAMMQGLCVEIGDGVFRRRVRAVFGEPHCVIQRVFDPLIDLLDFFGSQDAHVFEI